MVGIRCILMFLIWCRSIHVAIVVYICFASISTSMWSGHFHWMKYTTFLLCLWKIILPNLSLQPPLQEGEWEVRGWPNPCCVTVTSRYCGELGWSILDSTCHLTTYGGWRTMYILLVKILRFLVRQAQTKLHVNFKGMQWTILSPPPPAHP